MASRRMVRTCDRSAQHVSIAVRACPPLRYHRQTLHLSISSTHAEQLVQHQPMLQQGSCIETGAAECT